MAKKLYVLTCLAITGAGGSFLRHKDGEGNLIKYTEDQLGNVTQLKKEGRIEEVKRKSGNSEELESLRSDYAELTGQDAPKSWKANKIQEEIEAHKAQFEELESLRSDYADKGGTEDVTEATAEELKAKIEALEA